MTRALHTRAIAAVFLAAFMAVLFTSPVASAAGGGGGGGGGGKTDRNVAAMKRIIEGGWTQADIALIRSQPELAAQTPDPTPSGSSVEATATVVGAADSAAAAESAGAGAVAATNYAKDFAVTFIKKSLLGSIIYKWQKWVRVYYNGSTVYSLQERYDWLPAAQGMIKVRELVANSTSGLGTWRWNSMLQRHLEYCPAYAPCYADTYPWARFKIYGNGTWWYEGSWE